MSIYKLLLIYLVIMGSNNSLDTIEERIEFHEISKNFI
jgi:hypothetical protein